MPDQPSRFYATPAEIDTWLREHFAEDTLLHFYRAVGDAALDEIVTSGKGFRTRSEAEHGKHVYLAGMDDVLDWVQEDRYYPATLPDLQHNDRPVVARPEETP